MEIDHVFASGAVVGRATTHSWGRPAPRCARSDGRPHSCVAARPTTAPDAKTWSIPTIMRGVIGIIETKYTWVYNSHILSKSKTLLKRQLSINDVTIQKYFYTHTTKLLKGILVSLRPSFCLSVRQTLMLCPLCNTYSSGWINPILGINDRYH